MRSSGVSVLQEHWRTALRSKARKRGVFLTALRSQSLLSQVLEQIKEYLQMTKGRRGINVGEHFPNIEMFLLSAKYSLQKESGSGISEQEGWRLKNLIASKQYKKIIIKCLCFCVFFFLYFVSLSI